MRSSLFANRQRRLIGFVTSCHTQLKVFVMDPDNKYARTFDFQEVKMFIDDYLIPNGHVFKAFIVDLFTLFLQPSSSFHNNYDFCQTLKKKFEQLQIPSFFINEENYFMSCMLISKNISVDFGETVIILWAHPLPLPPIPQQQQNNIFGKTGQALLVAKLQYSPSGYHLIDRNSITFDRKMKPALLREQICGTTKPSKIIVNRTEYSTNIPFQRIFNKSKNLIFLEIDNCETTIVHKFMIEKYNWILDKSYTKFHILPTAAKCIRVLGDYGTKKNVLNIAKIDVFDALPVTKSIFVTRSVPEILVAFQDVLAGYCYTKVLPKNCHAVEINVQMNEENFVDVAIEILNLQNFDKVPSKMDSVFTSKVPFIVFFTNSSFIGVCKNGKYQFLEQWNGIYGKDCFISFDEKKPKFGEAAQKMLKTKNTFVVFDLLRIMAMASDDIQKSKTWGFTVTKDAENPVLLEFDNFDGTKKVASPPFLMALYLRQHLNAIKAETGEKPKEIAFCVINDEFNDDEMKRIKDGLEESCRLLKKEASFIDDEIFDVKLSKVSF